MKTFGLTGGIGMGKSTSAQILRARGVDVVDTDELARQIVEPGRPALAEIRATFGDEVFDPNGRLNRDAMAGLVFAAEAPRRKLEAILHPRIRELWRAQLESWRREGKPVAAVVIPLLFETKAETEFGAVICTACSATTQRQRLLARGWSPEQISQRLAAQIPAEEKMLRANFVVWTEADLDVHARQLGRIVGFAD